MHRALASLLLLSLTACATGVGVWPASGYQFPLNQADLEQEVGDSLTADGWYLAAGGAQRTYVKEGSGGQRTMASFRFEGRGTTSAFEIVGASDHVVNWLSLGILGLSMQDTARMEIEAWVRRFRERFAASP